MGILGALLALCLLGLARLACTLLLRYRAQHQQRRGKGVRAFIFYCYNSRGFSALMGVCYVVAGVLLMYNSSRSGQVRYVRK